MPIDMHAHWVPRTLADALLARRDEPYFRPGDDGRPVLHFRGVRAPQRITDADDAIATMDEAGMGMQLLSLGGLMLSAMQMLKGADAAPLCRLINDAAAEACRRHPDRLRALAVLPNEDMTRATAEYERAMRLPGFVGAILPGNGFLDRDRAEAWRPLFAAMQAGGGAHVLIHDALSYRDYAGAPGAAADNEHVRRATLGMQANLSAIMVTFNLTDFLDAFPDVSVQIHNLGGNVPFEVTRMDHLHLFQKRPGALPSRRFTRTMVDCNSFGTGPIELAVALYGADRIVLGTDGSAFGADWSFKAINAARIGEDEKRAILDGNAARILRRYARPAAAAAE